MKFFLCRVTYLSRLGVTAERIYVVIVFASSGMSLAVAQALRKKLLSLENVPKLESGLAAWGF